MALAAARALLSEDGGEPIHYVEAACLDPDKKATLVPQAARELVRHSNPVEAGKRIIKDFLSEIPRQDTIPDTPPTPKGGMPGGEAMRRGVLPLRVFGGARTKSKYPDLGSAPAPAPVPGPDPGEDNLPEAGPLPRTKIEEARRPMEDLLIAVEVLIQAIKYSPAVAPVIDAATAALNKLIHKMKDESAKALLTKAVTDLQEAKRAAGTADLESTDEKREAQVVLDRHLSAGGAGVEDIEPLCRANAEYTQLKATGHARMSRERYVELCMEKRKAGVDD